VKYKIAIVSNGEGCSNCALNIAKNNNPTLIECDSFVSDRIKEGLKDCSDDIGAIATGDTYIYVINQSPIEDKEII